MAFRWQADDGPTLNAGLGSFVIFQGIRTSIAKKKTIFFSGGPDPLFPHPLDPPMRPDIDPNSLQGLSADDSSRPRFD